MLNQLFETHEAEINGCWVVVDDLGDGSYAATVSYKSYDANGRHVASPVFCNIGSEAETKSFIVLTVKYASDHNKLLLKGLTNV